MHCLAAASQPILAETVVRNDSDRSGLGSKFPDMRSMVDIALNPSFRKSNPELSQRFYGIVLIIVATCSFRCTLSLYNFS